MTSQQLRAKLAEAIAIVTECERLMEDPHRQSLAEGGAE